MRYRLDRRTCSCWEAACESCFAGNLLQKFFCPACILEEVDDGSPAMTFEIIDRDGSEKTLVVTEENWGAAFDSWMLTWQEQQELAAF